MSFFAAADLDRDVTLAADTRKAVRRRPFLHEALRAGVVNYTAAARFLDLGETEAVAAALRRYAGDLPEWEVGSRRARVTMQSGLGHGEAGDALLAVGDTALVPDAGSLTGVLVTGEVGAGSLRQVLGCLAVEEVAVEAAGVAGEALLVVVERRAGPDALRAIEEALEVVPGGPVPTD